MRQCLHGVLRCPLNHEEKCAHVDDDERQDRFHDCLRRVFIHASATLVSLESAGNTRDSTAGQRCRVFHCPFVQVNMVGRLSVSIPRDERTVHRTSPSKRYILTHYDGGAGGRSSSQSDAGATRHDRHRQHDRYGVVPRKRDFRETRRSGGDSELRRRSVHRGDDDVGAGGDGRGTSRRRIVWALRGNVPHPWAGFAVRLTYWFCMMVVVGSEVVAAAIYCKFWFPSTPPWIWIGLFSLVILYVNATSVGNLGTFEYWLSMIKVVTIVAFLILATALLTGVGFPRLGFANFTAHGGFLPNGWKGVGLGVILGLFSFFGIEVVGST